MTNFYFKWPKYSLKKRHRKSAWLPDRRGNQTCKWIIYNWYHGKSDSKINWQLFSNKIKCIRKSK